MAIIRNAIRCKHCGDVIESRSVHDFKSCSCGACAVDGGLEYLRRCAKNSMEEDFEDISEVVPDNEALTEDELIDKVAREVMERYKPAFQELAKYKGTYLGE